MQIHFLGLQSPLRAIAHSPEPPKEQNEKENHRNSADREKSLFAEGFFQIAEAAWCNMNHFVAATPEKQSCDKHRDSRNSKCPTRPPIRLRQKPWTKDRGNKRTGVNGEIEPAKHL